MTRLEPGQASHRLPQFLPGGRRFLFFATGAPEVQGVFVGSLDSTDAKRLVDIGTRAEFVAPDRILFARGESLYSAANGPRIDDAARRPPPRCRTRRTVVQPFLEASPYPHRHPDCSRTVQPPRRRATSHGWTVRIARPERSGQSAALVGTPRVSPDGRTLAVTRRVNGNDDIWLIETARGVLRRFTFDAAIEAAPVWSPNGNRIAFESARKGLRDLFVKSLDASAEEVLVESSENKNISDWSADGRFISFAVQSPKTARDIWALPLGGDREAVRLSSGRFRGKRRVSRPTAAESPTSRTRRDATKCSSSRFPGPGVTGRFPQMAALFTSGRDGQEIFYIGARQSTDGCAGGTGCQRPRRRCRHAGGALSSPARREFTPLRPTASASWSTHRSDATASPITVVLNWKPGP